MDHHFYRRVWAPDGQSFEVNPERAADLVLNKGWSNTQPASKKTGFKKNTAEKAEKAPATMTVDEFEEATGAPAPENE